MGLFTFSFIRNQFAILAISMLIGLSFSLNGQNLITDRGATFENKTIRSFSKESNALELKTETEDSQFLRELSSGNKRNESEASTYRAAIDVEIVKLESPNDVVDICGSSTFDYIVRVKNLGEEVITSLTINKYINAANVGPSTFNNLSISTSDEQVLYLGTYPKPSTSFNISTYINSVNGQSYFNSNGELYSFHQYLPTTTLPYLEDYENYQLFSAIYQESFYIDQDIFLWRVGDESANCTGQLSAYFDNYTDTSVYGTFDGLLAPTIDFTNITNATLTFDYAYAQYTSASTTYNDSLIIAVATGCAPSTYYIIYEEGGAGLATASPHIDVFTPTCNEWQSIQVDLSQYSGEEYVTVAIVNHSGYGNILWVDNINIVETQPSNCSVSIISSPEICDLNNGSASAVISNTTGNVSYLWSNGATTSTITGLNAGVYGVSITDASGCTANASVVVNSSCNTNCSVLAFSTPVSCNGNDGTATAVASNTVGSISYLWSNGATSPIITGLSTGVYAVTITDGNGCTSSSSVNVNNGCNTNCTVTTISTPVSCAGNNGTATAFASNTVGNVTYLWSNGATSASISGLNAGVYGVSITDATGCISTSSVTVGNNCNTNCSVNTTSTPVSCNGNDGTASAIASNTVGNVTYLWSNGATTSNITGLSTGVYGVSITDATGCISTSSVTVGNNCNTNCSVNTTSTPVSCVGNNGTATATASNTVGNVTYLWSNGATTSIITGLSAGSYSVSITDATGCSSTSSVVVGNNCNTNCSVNTSSTPVSCNGNDGIATATATNTVGNVSYLWNTGATTATISGLSEGAYSVSITDATGCVATSSVVVNSNCVSNCNVEIDYTEEICGTNTGYALASTTNTTGSVHYTWSNGISGLYQNAIFGLSAGTYSVTAIDEDNCVATTSFNIESIPNCIADVGIVEHVISPSVLSACENTFDVVVKVENLGTETVNSLTIVSSINGGVNIQTINTGFSVSPGQISDFELPNVTLPNEDFTLRINITFVNGEFLDDNGSNDTLITNYQVLNSAQSLPFNEDFENENLPTSNGVYQIGLNNNDGNQWAIANESANCVGNNAAFFNNFDNPSVDNTNDALIIPSLDFTNISNAHLTLDYAYAQYQAGYTDSLYIKVSTDCGETYNNVLYANGGADLATTALNGNSFVPECNDWSNIEIDLSQFAGESSVTIAIINASDYGNNIWVDNINIEEVIPLVYDLAIKNIAPYNNASLCYDENENFTTAVIEIENLGTGTIKSVGFNRYINGQFNGIYGAGNINLAPGEKDTFEMQALNLPEGEFTFKSEIYQFTTMENVLITEDANPANDTAVSTYWALTPQTLPYFEDFENESLPTAEGLHQFGFEDDDIFDWKISQSASANCNGLNAALFVNYFGFGGENPSGTRDGLITPTFDFSTVVNPKLSFDYAYATYEEGFIDSLYVLVSTDCGETFNEVIFAEGNENLATAPEHVGPFVPECNEWQNIELDLSDYIGEPSVTIGIVNASGYGNDIWIDNINVEDEVPPIYDLAIKNIAPYNNASLCYDENENFTTAVIEIENLGTGTIKSVTFNRYINGQFNGIYGVGNINIEPGEKDTLDMQALNLPEGMFTFKSEIARFTTMEDVIITEDANPANDTSVSTYWALTPQTLPYFEDFENQSIPTASNLHQFGFENDDQFVWEIANQSAFCNGNNAAYFDNFNGSTQLNPKNTRDGLITPSFDFSTIDNAILSFDYAYAEFDNSIWSSDSLYILVSTDCGVNFNHVLYANGRASLATAELHSFNFIPECNEWGNIELDLSQFAGESSVTIAIVNVSDYGNNLWIDNINIEEAAPNNCSITIGSTSETCVLNDGTANAFMNNPNGSVTYLWSTGATTPTIIGLSAGTYTVIATDASGCTTTASVEVTFDCNTNCNLFTTSTPVTCSGNDGAAYAVATNTIGNVTYLWSNGATTSSISGLTAGVYTVTISDSIGCTQTANVIVNNICGQTCLVATMSTPTYCFGDVGTVTATTIGTVGPVSYLWSTGATTSTISGLSADTYSVTITDSLGCTSTSSAVVADNCNTACFVFTSSTPATCEENNGTATVTGGNMLLGYNILWSNGDTTQTISGLSPGIYSVTVVDGTGCEATSNVVVDYLCDTTCITTTTNQTLSGCDGFEVVVGTNIYSQTGVYTDVLTSIDGCDSIVITNLTVEDRITTNQTLSGCTGFSVTVGSNNYSQTGTYTDVLTSVNGCDSTVTTNLTIVNEFTTNQTVLGCQGFSIIVGANTYSATGIYTDVLTSVGGCDSTVITNLTIVDELTTNQTISGCTGFSLTVGDNVYTQSGIYTDVLTSENGCDSTVITNLIIEDEFLTNQTLTRCEGFEVIVGNNTYNQTGIYTDILTSVGGCDSIIITDLTILDEFTTQQSFSGCEGFSVTVGSNTYTETGVYTDLLTSANGCDSTVITNLTIVDEFTTEQTLSGCEGFTVTVGGNTYSESGVYTNILTSVDGCDSTVITNLTIVDEITTHQSFSGCQGFSVTVGNNTYTESGSYSDTFTTSNGCDSIVTTNLVILETLSSEHFYTGCVGFEVTVGDNTYSETGMYTDVFTSSQGCDSIVTTNLNIVEALVSMQVFTECEGFEVVVGNNIYNETGVYRDTFTSSQGCDSVVITNLTIENNFTTEQNFSGCEGLEVTVGDNIYSESGTYTDVLTTANGCDSTVITNLTIFENETTQQSFIECNGFEISVGSNTYSETGVYTDVLTSSNGCDSTIITELTILEGVNVLNTYERCIGFSIQVGSNTYTETGVYIDIFEADNGCDSTVVTNLTIVEAYEVSQTFVSCTGFEISVGNNTYSETGLYFDTLTSFDGCDSVVTTDLTIQDEFETVLNLEECDGFSIVVGDNIYSETGNYTDNLTAQGGCDSVVITNLVILSPVTTNQIFNECAGFETTVGNNTYNSTGVYIDTFVAANGCDSIVTTDLFVEEEVDVSVTVNSNTITANFQGFDYQWIDCTTNEPLDGFEGPSFTATADGSYAVIINGSSNCPDTSECIAIITTGVWDAIQTSINVYPNPTSDYFLIDAQEIAIENIELLNDIGQTIKNITYTGNIIRVEVAELPAGIYMLKFKTQLDSRFFFKKIIVN